MKYQPGNYSVTFFNKIGTKLNTEFRTNSGAPLTSLWEAVELAEHYPGGHESYVIQRVIVNSALNPGEVSLMSGKTPAQN